MLSFVGIGQVGKASSIEWFSGEESVTYSNSSVIDLVYNYRNYCKSAWKTVNEQHKK